MPYPIILTDTDATLAQFSDPFDTRGIGGFGLYTEVPSSLAPGFDGLNVLVFTRKAGKPWMFTPALEISNGTAVLSISTIWTLNGISQAGGPIPTEWIDGFTDLLDESLVVAQPALAGGGGTAASGDTVDTNLTFKVYAPFPGDFGNAFSVDLIDPGAPNSPLVISSVDGFVFTISLETDNMGAIVTTGNDLSSLLVGTGAPGWVLTVTVNMSAPVVTETVQLAGGAGGATGITYTVTGSY